MADSRRRGDASRGTGAAVTSRPGPPQWASPFPPPPPPPGAFSARKNVSPDRIRKYGRYDFHRFDHVSPWHVSAGEKDIGHVHVDCRLLFMKSKWGVLGKQENPGGIIYLDVGFTQPDGCKLKSATVEVALDESDEALAPFRTTNMAIRRQVPVQVRSLGPTKLTGEKKTVTVETSLNGTPSVRVLGNGVGGLGRDKRSTGEFVSRWEVDGQLVRGDDDIVYQGVRWTLEANKVDKKLLPAGNLFTAFSFENSGQPFFMKVMIRGKLAKMSSRWKNQGRRLLKSAKSNFSFGPREGQESDISTTLIGASTGRRFRLDRLANGLHRAMEMENLINGVPIEIRDSHPDIQFVAVPGDGEDDEDNDEEEGGEEDIAEDADEGDESLDSNHLIQTDLAIPASGSGGPPEPASIAAALLCHHHSLAPGIPPVPQHAFGSRGPPDGDARTEPTIENLVSVADRCFKPPAVREDMSGSSVYSTSTLVNKDSHAEDGARGPRPARERQDDADSPRNMSPGNEEDDPTAYNNSLAEQDAIEKMLEIQIVRSVLRWLASLFILVTALAAQPPPKTPNTVAKVARRQPKQSRPKK